MNNFFTSLWNLVFDCRHRNLSRVFTLRGRTYKVCCDCGEQFEYSWEKMGIIGKRGARGIPATSPASVPSLATANDVIDQRQTAAV